MPTARDINVSDSLDEQRALQNFLGKDLKQAEALFRENFICYQEDLMYMGPRAFAFYVRAAIRYLLSEEASGNADAANSFCGLLEHRLDFESDSLAPAAPLIREGILGMLEAFDRYGCNVVIYGDVASRYRQLLLRLTA